VLAQSINKLPASDRIRKFITVSTKPRHWALSAGRWIQSTSKKIHYFNINFSITFNLRLGLQNTLSPVLPTPCFDRYNNNNGNNNWIKYYPNKYLVRSSYLRSTYFEQNYRCLQPRYKIVRGIYYCDRKRFLQRLLSMSSRWIDNAVVTMAAIICQAVISG
jgi:hypothetical protein